MGLYIHSLGEIPAEAKRSYYVYLLDYGWDEPLGEAVRNNLRQMADAASRSDAVVIHGPRGVHFEDEVLSWHHINQQPSEDLLPAVMVTTRHPASFKESNEPFHPGRNGDRHRDSLLLIPLKKVCKTPEAVVAMVETLFEDIRTKKELKGFRVAKEMRRGTGGALVDALVLEPNISGVGIDLKKLARWFRRDAS